VEEILLSNKFFPIVDACQCNDAMQYVIEKQNILLILPTVNITLVTRITSVLQAI